VLQEVPEELKARTDARGEASLRGHLKAQGEEQTGSQSYNPPDPKDDKALRTALDLMAASRRTRLTRTPLLDSLSTDASTVS
jgi:carboxyl-terminal processing protease